MMTNEEHEKSMLQIQQAKERHESLYDFWCDVVDREDVHAYSFSRVHHIAEWVGYDLVCRWIVQAYAKVCDSGLDPDNEDIAIGRYVSATKRAMAEGRLVGDDYAQKK